MPAQATDILSLYFAHCMPRQQLPDSLDHRLGCLCTDSSSIDVQSVQDAVCMSLGLDKQHEF
jgi:hypothetical protein